MPIDFADEAQQRTEEHLKAALSNRKTLTIPFSGKCLCCEEPVVERRFCNSDCREQYEHEQKRKVGIVF